MSSPFFSLLLMPSRIRRGVIAGLWVVVSVLLPIQAAAMVNDRFSGAEKLGGLTAGGQSSLFGASMEPGEVKIGPDAQGKTLWWVWTAPSECAVEVTLQTVGESPSSEPVTGALGVCIGNSVSTLQFIARDVNRDARCQFLAHAGVTYYLEGDLGDADARAADLLIRLAAVPLPPLADRPANDDMANAKKLASLKDSDVVNNLNATAEVEEPLLPFGTGYEDSLARIRSVWWTWTAPKTGFLHINTFGSTIASGAEMDTVLCVYHHWPIGGMSSFAAAVNDDAGASLCSEVTLMVEAGERFDIALYSAPYSPGGTARIQVEFLDRSPAPAWKATSLAGERVGSSSFLGNVVLLNIWATWCPPCIAETPALVKLQEKYRDYGFTVVGVSMDSPAEGGPPLPQRVGDFVTAKGINYPVLLEYPAGTIRNAYGYVALPTSYVIDRSGNIVDFWTGAALDDASNLARFERAIRPHLGIVPVITGTRTGDGKLELSWPDVTDAVLESRRFLSDSWAANFARVTISNGRAQVNLPIDARSQFFRLRTQ